jgi:chromosome segregation ATPase
MNANEAADLIESQAAENAAYRAENERLAADLKDMRDQNQTISEKNRELCIKLDEREKNSKATQKAMLDEIAKLRNDLTAKTAQLAAEQITSQSLRNAANGYKLELDAERKKANDARNELCLKCGRYHEAHNGACDGCRWRDDT